jgi:hypothetical protein
VRSAVNDHLEEHYSCAEFGTLRNFADKSAVGHPAKEHRLRNARLVPPDRYLKKRRSRYAREVAKSAENELCRNLSSAPALLERVPVALAVALPSL